MSKNTSFFDIFDIIENVFSEEKEIYFISIINSIQFLIRACLLDLYFLARMLKNPIKDVNSTLSLCYFGDGHIFNIVSVLKHFFGYENIFSIDRNVNEYLKNHFGDQFIVKRCIKIDKHINLKKDIESHHKMLFDL